MHRNLLSFSAPQRLRGNIICNQKGVSIVAVIAAMLILSVMGVTLISLVTTGSDVSINQLQSEQAFNVAEGGLEYAKNQFENGTICGNLNYSNVVLGQGIFTTTGTRYIANSNLSSAITNADTVIPVASIANFAPQGRIRIENEEITYTGTSAVAANCLPYAQPCLTGALRGAAGTAAVLHNLNDTYGVAIAASQDMCRVNSAGTVGSANRTVVVDVPGYASAAVSAYLDGQPTLIGSAAMTKIGSLKTELAAGDNLIIVVVTLQNTSGVAATTINAGNLRLMRDGAILNQNVNLIRVQGTIIPAANNFPQETQFLLYKDIGAPALPTYDVIAQASANNRISAKVKMLVFSNVPNSQFFNDVNVLLTTAAAGAILSNHATILPAGDNVILAAVQLNNVAGGNRTIAAGDLKLRRGGGAGAMLTQNIIALGLEANNIANQGTGYLLIARDPGIGANQTYTVTGRASNNNSINGAVNMLVLNGLQSAFLPTALINPVPTAAITTLGSLLTPGFPAGDNIIISATQYYNAAAANRNIVADQLVYGAATSSNVLPIYLGVPNQVDDYQTGLLLHHTGAPATPTYNWQSQANGATCQADTEMAAIHLNINSIPLFGWREIFP